MKYRKYTFICNYGRNRSFYAARVTRELAQERNLDLKADFIWLYPEESEACEKREAKRLKESNKIFVMTSEIGKTARERYHIPKKKIVCLNIEDDYDCDGLAGETMTRMLKELLRKKLDKWVR